MFKLRMGQQVSLPEAVGKEDGWRAVGSLQAERAWSRVCALGYRVGGGRCQERLPSGRLDGRQSEVGESKQAGSPLGWGTG